MATKPMKTIKLPGLPDTYTFLQEADVDAKIENMAVKDGYYQDMTVGDAEQLVSSQFVEDNVPYKYRTSGGSADVGNREYVDKIVGGTIAWNQFIHPAAAGSATSNGITFTNNSDGSWSVSGTATNDAFRAFAAVTTIHGHKYFFKGAPSNASISTYYDYLVGIGAIEQKNEIGKGVILNAPNAGGINCVIYVKSGTDLSTPVVFTPQLFDLTQMFGSTIADAIYAMEQATAGAGVQWFRKLFPNDYYEYNAGELISVSGLQSHDMVGFNLWDEEWEVGYIDPTTGVEISASDKIRMKNFMRVLPNTTYYKKSPYPFWCVYFDENKKYVGYGDGNTNRTFTTPSNARYMRSGFELSHGTTYKHDICINLSWSGTRDGEYQPYAKHSYPLDSTLTLRGVPKLSADNQLYFDGDEYLPEGKVNRRYGVVDLGTLTYEKFDIAEGTMYRAAVTGIHANAQIICTKYPTVTANARAEKTIYKTTGMNVDVVDSTYTTEADFKAAMSGVMLVYELATPTEETAEPYSEIQLVNDWGTEEYVSGTICPVGHETRYPANLRDKLQHLPDLASADGYYMIQQTGAQMSLVLFRIPQATGLPDGSYTLKATVSGGTPTYTWVNDNGEESGT